MSSNSSNMYDTVSGLNIQVSEDVSTVRTPQNLLTYLYFDKKSDQETNCLTIQTDLPALESTFFAQYWYTGQKITQGTYKNIQFSHATQMLFGHIQLTCEDNNNLQDTTQQAYTEIFACLEHHKCVHLLRTWNFFPEITKPLVNSENTNRYDLFCRGRRKAMQNSSISSQIYPAATVIGNQSNKLQIYFLAGDTPGIAVENPRQTSAYHYPVANTVDQPLFSRGILKAWGQRTHFYVSGTASIVGHETRHLNDVSAQLNEAINNVETLVAHANDQYLTQLNAQDDLLYVKVYLRNRDNIASVKQVLDSRLSNTTPRVLLLGDMCREDLLVEIEAFYQA